MVLKGRVQKGVVVLDQGVDLPEGQDVTVLVTGPVLGGFPEKSAGPHSALDVPTVSVGAVLRPLTSDDDLLGEMLEGRP